MTSIAILLCVLAVLVLPSLVVSLIICLSTFLQELRYLNTEIARTEGAERSYWKQRRRRLWLSLIPFVRY